MANEGTHYWSPAGPTQLVDFTTTCQTARRPKVFRTEGDTRGGPCRRDGFSGP
jgi:hypothetical protein